MFGQSCYEMYMDDFWRAKRVYVTAKTLYDEPCVKLSNIFKKLTT